MAWQKVASLDAICEGEALGVEVDGKAIALVRIGDEVHAIDGICTHALALLADGFVDGATIECPLHQAVFDIRTGEVLSGPAPENLKVYAVKLDGADILINLSETSGRVAAPSVDAAASQAAPSHSSGNGSNSAGGGATEVRDMRDSTILLSKQ